MSSVKRRRTQNRINTKQTRYGDKCSDVKNEERNKRNDFDVSNCDEDTKDKPKKPPADKTRNPKKMREAGDGAATDAALRAEILSYSRSRGLFAGAYLDGSTLRPDNNANQKLYGNKQTAKEIALEGKVAPPSSAEELLATLNKRSPKHLAA